MGASKLTVRTTMEWDSIVWNAEIAEDDNELRLAMEGKCSNIDEGTFRQLQSRGIEVKNVKIEAEGTRTTGGGAL